MGHVNANTSHIGIEQSHTSFLIIRNMPFCHLFVTNKAKILILDSGTLDVDH